MAEQLGHVSLALLHGRGADTLLSNHANCTKPTDACSDLKPALSAAEGDGTKVYASCLTFYDRVPSDLCAKHEDLLGAVALKAMCLLSRSPYLTSSQQVLSHAACNHLLVAAHYAARWHGLCSSLAPVIWLAALLVCLFSAQRPAGLSRTCPSSSGAWADDPCTASACSRNQRHMVVFPCRCCVSFTVVRSSRAAAYQCRTSFTACWQCHVQHKAAPRY